MMKLIAVLALLSLASAQDFMPDEWKHVKSPLDSPRYQLILSNLFPEQALQGKVNRGGRIAGGELAKLGQFKHQALLLTKDIQGDDYVCGGAIISHNWILTVIELSIKPFALHSLFKITSKASHCLDEIVKIEVYVGIIDRINGPAVWYIDVTDTANMIMHESYNPSNLLNDIALIRLVNTIKTDVNVAIVQLPSRADASVNLDGKLASISGFGRTSDTSGPSQHLKWVQTSIAANEKCEKVFGKANVKDTNLCLDTSGGRSTCQGDSGGGLTVDLAGTRIIVGVVSFGAAISCTQNHPAVFTRVTSYLDWIETKTKIKIN